MIRAGVIGYGYWGPNVARAISEVPGLRLTTVADTSEAARLRCVSRHPSVATVDRWQAIVADPEIDAVVIATPVSTHYEIALAALMAGKHVLVEKPMADTVARSKRLVDEAARRGLVLMVDHTFIYTPAIRKMRELVDSGEVGDVYYYDSTRVNLGLIQSDVSVIWDLAVHDFAIMDYLLASPAVAISASSATFVPGSPANLAHLTIYHANNSMAHLSVSWLSPVKIRQTILGGSRRMVIYDDMQTSEKVKVYDCGATSSGTTTEQRIAYRTGDMWAPALSGKEALLTEMEDFARCIETGDRPVSDGECGLRVVELLEAASRSTAMRGQPVELVQMKVAI